MMDIALEEAERLQKLTQSAEPQTQAEMPRYLCHKQVWALKIADIQPAPTQRKPTIEELEAILKKEESTKLDILPSGEIRAISGATIVPSDAGFAPFQVSGEYMKKHTPEVGGYYVVYADGYKSYSPAKAFEDGYTRVP